MNEEYEGSMDDEKCENCTYYRNDICLRKAGDRLKKYVYIM